MEGCRDSAQLVSISGACLCVKYAGFCSDHQDTLSCVTSASRWMVSLSDLCDVHATMHAPSFLISSPHDERNGYFIPMF